MCSFSEIVESRENIEHAHDSSSEQANAGSIDAEQRPGFHTLYPVFFLEEQGAACGANPRSKVSASMRKH